MPPHCFICDNKAERSIEHDAFYCPACNQWLETPCSNPRCAFCFERPQYPLRKENLYVQAIPIIDEPLPDN